MPAGHKPGALNLTSSANAPQPLVDIEGNAVTARLPTGQTVQVNLTGATVTSWTNKDGSENIWLSDKAILDGSKPIRGGIPIVFPVFGPPPKEGHATSKLPQHGFARNVRWEFLGKSSSESAPSKGDTDSSVKLDFGLYSTALDEKYTSAWPLKFGLVYSVTLAPESLTTMLSVRNEGTEKFEFQALLHSYFRVKDVTTTKVIGLAAVEYVDKVLDAKTHTQSTPEITITGEVDRVYSKIPQDTTTIIEGGKPRFDIIRDGVTDTVVWNPWKEKAASMGDFEPKDGYMRMLAIEVGAVSSWIALEGGESWEGGQIVKSLL